MVRSKKMEILEMRNSKLKTIPLVITTSRVLDTL